MSLSGLSSRSVRLSVIVYSVSTFNQFHAFFNIVHGRVTRIADNLPPTPFETLLWLKNLQMQCKQQKENTLPCESKYLEYLCLCILKCLVTLWQAYMNYYMGKRLTITTKIIGKEIVCYTFSWESQSVAATVVNATFATSGSKVSYGEMEWPEIKMWSSVKKY